MSKRADAASLTGQLLYVLERLSALVPRGPLRDQVGREAEHITALAEAISTGLPAEGARTMPARPPVTPGASYPQRRPCPACGEPILVTLGSRHGGQAEAFDPEPGLEDGRCNTLLAEDLSHIAVVAAQTAPMRGKIPLWRPHRYTCGAQMRIPGGEPLPNWGGYSHAAAGWKGARP